MKRIQYFGLIFCITLTCVQSALALQDRVQFAQAAKQNQLESDEAESLFELLKETKSNEFGDFGGNTFGPQFNFHSKEEISKKVAKFSKIKGEERFQQILLEKLNKPSDLFAAYQILNGSYNSKHQIKLLGNVVLKSGDIGWIAGITVGSDKQEVTIGEEAIRAILFDHWTKQFRTMNKEAKMRKRNQ